MGSSVRAAVAGDGFALPADAGASAWIGSRLGGIGTGVATAFVSCAAATAARRSASSSLGHAVAETSF